MGVIADGPLLDSLRRAVTFGLFLVAWMCARTHPASCCAMAEITDYLGLGATPTGTKNSASPS
jgi:phosphoenolpyruvate carboxylase